MVAPPICPFQSYAGAGLMEIADPAAAYERLKTKPPGC